MPEPEPQSVAQVREGLGQVGYLADEAAALVSFLAQRLGKPVLVEGPAGVGKTELAKALSRATDRRLVRLQCYEGLDEAKALYEWNYRKQLLRIQAESGERAAEGSWEATRGDIFSEEFLLTRPLLEAISAEDAVVLLIDEIDKTDQEFEAMLLEVLSDFQISIPELGVIEARTRPIVVLTSNNSRELTEALKRRCLYLWLDYPSVERELEIVRLHAPELDEGLARRLVEIVHMVRQLDLKKPPSIAESIDWARTLLLIGADDIDRETFESSMSILVKHRSDIDLVAERVAVKLGATACRPGTARLIRELSVTTTAGSLLAFFEDLRSEGVAVGTSEILDAFAALDEVSWTDQRDFRESLAATIAKSQEDRRIFELLFDRHFFRAAEAEALERGIEDERFEGGGRPDRPRRAARGDPPRDHRGQRRRDARPRPPRDDRLRAPGRALGRDRRRRAADPPRPRPAGARPARRRDAASRSTRENVRQFERYLRRELERATIERTGKLPPSRPLAELDRDPAHQPRPGPGRGPPRGRPAEAADRDPRPRAARAAAGARRSTSAGRCAPRSRPAACRCGCATGRSGRGGPRSTCSATSRPR